ncbi:MAG: 2'-5' RNA ligase family protein [Candidatus Saccharibacteria bacterium]|nr:2'-5' RNA ligase family protein [Candidatus Saccharibacteria bacterium]
MHNRYFIGLTLPDELSERIHELQNEFHEPGKTMQPLVPHITLLPPNLLMSVSPMYLLPKLRPLGKAFLPLNIHLAATDMFGARVLFLTVENDRLKKLRREMLDLLPEKVQKSYSTEYSFTPHVTLLQAKPKQALPDETIKAFTHRLEPLLPREYTANRLHVFTRTKPRTYTVRPVNKR